MRLTLSVPEAAEAVGTAPSTLYRWIRSGHFPQPRKIGPSRAVFLRREVEEWIEKQPRAEIGKNADPASKW